MVLTVSFLYSQHAKKVLVDTQIEYAQQLTSNSDKYLGLNLNNIKGFILSIANDPKLSNDSYEEIQEWFRDYLLLYIPNSKNIHLLVDNEVVASSSYTGWLLKGDKQFTGNVMNIANLNQLSWSSPYYSKVSGQTVTAVTRIKNNSDAEIVLALDLDLPQLYQNIYPDISGNLILLDQHEQPLYGSAPYITFNPFIGEYEVNKLDLELVKNIWSATHFQSQGDHLYIKSQTNPLQWQVVFVLDKNDIFSSLQRSIEYYWSLTIVSLILSAFIACIVSILIGRPIKLIANSMDHVGLGLLNTKIDLKRNDELGFLAKHFNDMTKKINDLMNQLKKTEAAKKEADFIALQSQIRPHFLFNTLNTISIVARTRQYEKVDQLISSFSETIHYSLDSSPSLVSFRDEIKALESYIKLMQIRYDDQFDFEFDIDEKTLAFLLPKFSLQPLVENSIFHGLVAKKDKGTLFIGTEIDNNQWHIILEDTGIGMTPEKLSEMKASLTVDPVSQSKHIGLRNVHSRLMLAFDKAYQIEIKSNSNHGTCIILTLPIRKEEKLSC